MLKYDYRYTRYVFAGLVVTALSIKHNWTHKAIIAATTAIAGYFAGIEVYVIAIGALVVADVITGIWASFKRDELFSSKKLGRGLIQKTALYSLIMASSFVIGKVINSALPVTTYWMTWVLTLLILLYELSSVIENIVVINPDMVFLRRFSGLFEKIVDKQEQNIENILGASPAKEEAAVAKAPAEEETIQEEEK